MKRAYSLKLRRYLAPALLLSLLAGCLTSPNAFCEEKDIVQDSRFVGTFVSDESGLMVKTFSNRAPDKNYLVQLTEGGKTSGYRATVFKLTSS